MPCTATPMDGSRRLGWCALILALIMLALPACTNDYGKFRFSDQPQRDAGTVHTADASPSDARPGDR